MRAAGVELLADVARLSAMGRGRPSSCSATTSACCGACCGRCAPGHPAGAAGGLPGLQPGPGPLPAPAGRDRALLHLPTVWAWRRGRLRTIRRTVRRMLCIFPFEEPMYRESRDRRGYVGHPMMSTLPEVEAAGHFRRRLGLADDEVPSPSCRQPPRRDPPTSSPHSSRPSSGSRPPAGGALPRPGCFSRHPAGRRRRDRRLLPAGPQPARPRGHPAAGRRRHQRAGQRADGHRQSGTSTLQAPSPARRS